MKTDRFRQLYAHFVRIYEDSEPCFYRHSDTPFVDPTLNSRCFQILNARREVTSR